MTGGVAPTVLHYTRDQGAGKTPFPKSECLAFAVRRESGENEDTERDESLA